MIIDRIFHTLARRWLLFLNLAVALYVALPMLAPVLMNAGLTGPAALLYLSLINICRCRRATSRTPRGSRQA